MKISFVQSGGFMEVPTGWELDTEEFTPDKAQELKRIVNTSRISTSGEFFSRLARDLQQYRITIEDNGLTISVTYDDSTLPTTARLLIDYLQELAVPKPLTNR